MVLGKLPVPGRPTIWITVGQGPTALTVGAGGGCLDIFTLIYPFFPLSPSLWEMARYRLKYCLKGPLNPKPTNQPTIYEKTRLEQIQYEAARVVTGLIRSVSIDKLVKEIGWLPLSERRLFQKSVLMYKIKNGLAPEYLCNLMPPLVADRTVYNLRNIEDITVLRRRTELFSKSFIPSTTSYWNSLPMCIRNADSLNSFKSQLKSSIFKVPKIPQQFIFGSCVFSVLHCRIRNNCSNLIAILCNHFTFYIGGSARVVSDFSQTFSVCVLSHKNM